MNRFMFAHWLAKASLPLSGVQQLRCADLSIGYQAQAPVQAGITATFQAGKLYALLGENGSGKSCLLKSMAGLLPVLYGSLSITTDSSERFYLAAPGQRDLNIEKRAAWQGYLEQQPLVHWGISVRQVVELAAFARRDWSPQQAAAAVEEALVACDCMALAERSVLQISAGERQRVMIARVLAAQPALILVDEPTAGLDPRHQHAVMQLLRAQAERGVMVISVMHDIALTRTYCDQAMLLEKPQAGGAAASMAEPAQLGTVEDILTPQRVRRVFGIDG